MVQKPSHVKQLSPIHVCKIGLIQRKVNTSYTFVTSVLDFICFRMSMKGKWSRVRVLEEIYCQARSVLMCFQNFIKNILAFRVFIILI
jgi:hypothetical protein